MTFVVKCIGLVLAALIVWELWRASRPRPIFVVRLSDGEPRTRTGVVTAAFLQRLREISAVHGIRTGQVRGMSSGRRIRLEFSRDIPDAARQQLRNWWAVSGWGAGSSASA
jgi:Protein of unknown function (DUF3634)